MNQVYTYYSTETVFPTAKLTARNLNTVRTGDFTVKLSAPMICGFGNFEDETAEVPTFIRQAYVYTGVYIRNIDGATRRENKRLFELLEGKVPIIDIKVGIEHGSCQYLKFTRIGEEGYVATLSDLP
jgi:hypothetical protein